MKDIEKKLEDITIKKRIGLWRSHPSFFFVAIYLMFDSLISSISFFSRETNISSYANLFEVIPQQIYASIFVVVFALIAISLLTKRHQILRVAGIINVIPLSMMVVNFLTLFSSLGLIGYLVAASKWGLIGLMSFLMTREPFINPVAAKE